MSGDSQNTRVIVGIDDSLAGLRALRMAVTEARRRHAVLHAIRVFTFNPTVSGRVIDDRPYEDIEREVIASISDTFAKTMGGVPEDIKVHRCARQGAPGRVLVDYATRDDDLLLVGAAQRGWLRRLFRRSVSRYCLAHACCPVLAVPPDNFAKVVSREGVRAIRRDLSELGR